MIEETIYGLCPSKSNSYRIGHRGLFKTKALTDYEAKFYIQCKNRDKLISGYFQMQMEVFYPNERSDLDGALKVVMDCLQKCKVIKNDNRCVKLVIEKFLDPKNPRIEIKISEILLK